MPAFDEEPRDDKAQDLRAQCESELQRAFIDLLVQPRIRLARQSMGNRFAPATVRPDFAFHADGSALGGVRRRRRPA